MTTRPKSMLSALVLAAILLTSCGAFDAFRAGFAASKPFIQSLVTSGAISQAQADNAVADITAGVQAATDGDNCIKKIPSSLASGPKRVEKAKCYLQVATDIRQILERHNLGGNKLLDQIAMIAQGAADAFEAYYNNVTSTVSASKAQSSAGADQSAKAADGSADKDLEKTLNNLTQQMKDVNKELKAQGNHR